MSPSCPSPPPACPTPSLPASAALKWLEGGGREDAAELAERYGVHVLSEIPYDPLPMGGDDDR